MWTCEQVHISGRADVESAHGRMSTKECAKCQHVDTGTCGLNSRGHGDMWTCGPVDMWAGGHVDLWTAPLKSVQLWTLKLKSSQFRPGSPPWNENAWPPPADPSDRTPIFCGAGG